MSILVIDDYAIVVKIIRDLLHRVGFDNIDEASDGEQALKMLRDKHYDLIISDWNMAPMTGLELLREVRADGQLKAIPFIMVTAESKAQNIAIAQEAGVSNYIVKPFDAETLKNNLAGVLGPFDLAA